MNYLKDLNGLNEYSSEEMNNGIMIIQKGKDGLI